MTRPTSSAAWCGSSPPLGSCTRARVALMSGSSLRLLDELVHRARVAGAVDEPGVELLAGVDDRLTGVAQVRDVVQRVVQAEDVDAVLGRRRDEAAHEVDPDRARADEEAAAQRQPERRRRPGLQRADALPRALDAPPDRGVEDAAARDLEAGKAGLVEHLGDPRAARRSGPCRRAAPARAGG